MRMQSIGPRYSLVTILQSLRFKLRFLNREGGLSDTNHRKDGANYLPRN